MYLHVVGWGVQFTCHCTEWSLGVFLLHRLSYAGLDSFCPFLQVLYPNNKLRNLAWDLVRTPYILLSDLDFIPDYNVYSRLRAHLKRGVLNDTKGVGRAKKCTCKSGAGVGLGGHCMVRSMHHEQVCIVW